MIPTTTLRTMIVGGVDVDLVVKQVFDHSFDGKFHGGHQRSRAVKHARVQRCEGLAMVQQPLCVKSISTNHNTWSK